MVYKNKERKVLFIAYLFPPVGGGGVQRSSKFAKYLTHFGWQPHILTVKEPYDFYKDESLLAELDETVIVHRTFSIEPMKLVRKYLLRKEKKQLNEMSAGQRIKKKSLKPGFLVKLKTLILVPDNEILWLPFAVWKGLRIIKREKILVIYSTASPFTDHLIALFLAKFSGLPWVADFRDFWVDRANFPHMKWRLYVDRKLEKWVLNKADHIITSTRRISEQFKEINPHGKFTTITNGYDEEDFVKVRNSKPSKDKFIIAYTGIFNREQNPRKVFLALKNLVDENEVFRTKVQLRFTGQLDNPGDADNINLLNSLKLNEYSELSSYKPHNQIISEICQSNILLLLIGEYPRSEDVLTGKIFEYLRSGRPILAVVPENGLAAEIIRETKSGIVVSNSSIDEIYKGLLKLFDLYLSNSLEQKFEFKGINKFNRKNLTESLSRILNDLTDNKSLLKD